MKITAIIVAIILLAGVWVSGFVFTPQNVYNLGDDLIGDGGYLNQVVDAFAGLGDMLNSVLRFFGLGLGEQTQSDNEAYWENASSLRYWLARVSFSVTYAIYGSGTMPHLDMYPGIYAHPDYNASHWGK